jgi:alkylated DNA nucleotide flippase Atl1
MVLSANDINVISVLDEMLAEEALPRLLDLKSKVDSGGVLNKPDIAFLSRITHHARQSERLIDLAPERGAFWDKVLKIHGEIINQAMNNMEKAWFCADFSPGSQPREKANLLMIDLHQD